MKHQFSDLSRFQLVRPLGKPYAVFVPRNRSEHDEFAQLVKIDFIRETALKEGDQVIKNAGGDIFEEQFSNIYVVRNANTDEQLITDNGELICIFFSF